MLPPKTVDLGEHDIRVKRSPRGFTQPGKSGQGLADKTDTPFVVGVSFFRPGQFRRASIRETQSQSAKD